VCFLVSAIYGLDGGAGSAAGGGCGHGFSTMKRATICAFGPSHQEHTGDYYNNMIFHHSI
jgi:hypothetical protein